MKKGILAKITVVLTVCTLAAGSVAVYAAADNSGSAASGSQSQSAGTKRGFGYRIGNLSQLVSDGVIDQATADSIQAYLNQKRTEMQNSVANMTPDQAKAYFESQPKTDIFADMVSSGIITQAAADAIKAAEQANEAAEPKEGMRGFGMGMNLGKLVTDGVIDQPTADAIQAYMAQKKTEMQNEMNNVKNMTPDQAKAYFESKPKTDMYADMVSQGVISQATADARRRLIVP